ncbi:hypothetical protein [Nocardia sp. NPDC052566]|uniref:hypothetical protein n=1 Tax=Nocardia sp. NPDC052566 TaxID=3364330 RepID=UPI0037C8E69A
MTTTAMRVDPQGYYAAATALNTAAHNWYQALDARWDALSACGNMCGSYEEARTWAASYDERSVKAIIKIKAIARAAGNYATIIQRAGYNHELAEWKAIRGPKGAPPGEPSLLDPPVPRDRIPPPSAGGPGQGLIEDVVIGNLSLGTLGQPLDRIRGVHHRNDLRAGTGPRLRDLIPPGSRVVRGLCAKIVLTAASAWRRRRRRCCA